MLFLGISKSYSSSIQRAVSKSIFKEIKEHEASFENDTNSICDYIAWNACKLAMQITLVSKKTSFLS